MSSHPLSAAIAAIRRHLFGCLLATYVVAALFPGAGNLLRSVTIGEGPLAGGEVNPTHLLLAVLMLNVGMSIDPKDIAKSVRAAVSVEFAGTWLIPLGILLFIQGLPRLGLTDPQWNDFLLGAAVTLSMPSANSAAIWTNISEGNVVRTIVFIVMGTIACPIIVPVSLLVFVPSDANAIHISSLASSLEVLVLFVVVPVGVGIFAAHRKGQSQHSGTDWRAFIGIFSLLLLNYANGAAGLHMIYRSMAVPMYAAILCAGTFFTAVFVSSLSYSGWREGVPFVYATAMRNTGAALVLTVSVFPARPEVSLVPIFYTVTQHVLAALFDRQLPCAAVRGKCSRDAAA